MLFCWIKRCVFGAVAWVGRCPLSNAIEGVVTLCTLVERDYEWHVVVPVLVIACVSVNRCSTGVCFMFGQRLIASCPLRGFGRRHNIFDTMFVVEHAFCALPSRLGFFLWTLGFVGVSFVCAVPCRAHSVADLESGGQFVSLFAFFYFWRFVGSRSESRRVLQHCACQSRIFYNC